MEGRGGEHIYIYIYIEIYGREGRVWGLGLGVLDRAWGFGYWGVFFDGVTGSGAQGMGFVEVVQ